MFQNTANKFEHLYFKHGASRVCDGSAHSSGCMVNGSNAMAAIIILQTRHWIYIANLSMSIQMYVWCSVHHMQWVLPAKLNIHTYK